MRPVYFHASMDRTPWMLSGEKKCSFSSKKTLWSINRTENKPDKYFALEVPSSTPKVHEELYALPASFFSKNLPTKKPNIDDCFEDHMHFDTDNEQQQTTSATEQEPISWTDQDFEELPSVSTLYRDDATSKKFKAKQVFSNYHLKLETLLNNNKFKHVQHNKKIKKMEKNLQQQQTKRFDELTKTATTFQRHLNVIQDFIGLNQNLEFLDTIPNAVSDIFSSKKDVYDPPYSVAVMLVNEKNELTREPRLQFCKNKLNVASNQITRKIWEKMVSVKEKENEVITLCLRLEMLECHRKSIARQYGQYFRGLWDEVWKNDQGGKRKPIANAVRYFKISANS